MKFIILLTLFFTTQFVQARSVQVIDIEYGFSDYQGNPTLCMGIYRDLSTGENIALVEDLTDCFWTRKANKKLGEVISIPDKYFNTLPSNQMSEHLKSFDVQLTFFYSEYD